MTQIPAGWYPDPDPDVPDQQRGQRYWDGATWTEHVQAPPGAYPQDGGPGAPYSPMPGYGGVPTSLVATTPDGQPLAGWWQRAGAYVVDLIITSAVVSLIGLPWVRDMFAAFSDVFRDAMEAAREGSPMPDQSAFQAEVAEAAIWLALIRLGVDLVYHAGFLKWRAATPGKLLLGLRVRLREAPGTLSWATVLRRWLGQFWFNLAAFIPLIGGVAGFWPLVDLLWPLWDDKKQALHDKVAKTNVVRTR